MCGAPEQTVELPPGTDLARHTVLTGKVIETGAPAGGAFVRLLDASGEFTAEVVSSASGDFRFFVAPGQWTVRALHRSSSGRSSSGEARVTAAGPGLYQTEVALA